jgi:hypothetical protein
MDSLDSWFYKSHLSSTTGSTVGGKIKGINGGAVEGRRLTQGECEDFLVIGVVMSTT